MTYIQYIQYSNTYYTCVYMSQSTAETKKKGGRKKGTATKPSKSTRDIIDEPAFVIPETNKYDLLGAADALFGLRESTVSDDLTQPVSPSRSPSAAAALPPKAETKPQVTYSSKEMAGAKASASAATRAASAKRKKELMAAGLSKTAAAASVKKELELSLGSSAADEDRLEIDGIEIDSKVSVIILYSNVLCIMLYSIYYMLFNMYICYCRMPSKV